VPSNAARHRDCRLPTADWPTAKCLLPTGQLPTADCRLADWPTGRRHNSAGAGLGCELVTLINSYVNWTKSFLMCEVIVPAVNTYRCASPRTAWCKQNVCLLCSVVSCRYLSPVWIMSFAGIYVLFGKLLVCQINDEVGSNDVWNVNIMTKCAFGLHSCSFISVSLLML
jgi:hypothetical protein